MSKKPNIAWITVNRACNMRCKWCYAAQTDYNRADDMPYDLFCSIVDFLSDLGIRKVILIGGEPTIYPNIIEAIQYCRTKDINVVIPSNGVVFANMDVLEQFSQAGLSRVGLSLKAFDRQGYIDDVGFDCFDDVLTAIANLSKQDKISFSVSSVITAENIAKIPFGFDSAYKAGARQFGLSFCYDFGCLNANRKRYSEEDIQANVIDLIDGFVSTYDDIHRVTHGHFSINQTFPLCLWDKEFIAKLYSRKQITSVCQLLRHSGIIFDTSGNIIPCNAMHGVVLGKFGVDFKDIDDFKMFWESDQVDSAYKMLSSVPDSECNECGELEKCGGGCVSNWFNYSFDDIRMFMRKEAS